jgi:hypothetical protein
VGIGTSNPAGTLDVYKASGGATVYSRSLGSTVSDYGSFTAFANNGTYVTQMLQYGNGPSYVIGSGTVMYVGTQNLTAVSLITNNTIKMTVDTNGVVTTANTISDVAGNVRDLVNNAQSGAYVPAVTDNGKMINITTGGVTINASIFSAGQNVTVYNNSASSQTITQGTGVTMYLAGTATTGNRTLAQRGLATVVCVSANTFVISGAGLT